MKQMKRMVLMVALLAVMVTGAAPAFAEQAAAEEIAVTGVVKDAPDKADGTPTYGITEESSITGTAPPVGYLLEGDYSAYVGQRVTVYGIPRQDHGVRVLDVTRGPEPAEGGTAGDGEGGAG